MIRQGKERRNHSICVIFAVPNPSIGHWKGVGSIDGIMKGADIDGLKEEG